MVYRVGDIIMDLDASRLELAPASALIIHTRCQPRSGLGACLLLAPVALYLALSDD